MGEVKYFEFANSFKGKQFYNHSTGKAYDKWEVYHFYVNGNITWLELQRNNSWIRHEDKLGWSNGILKYQITPI